MAEGSENDEGNKPKNALVMTIAAVAVLSLVGGGGGWFLGSMLAKDENSAVAKTAPPAEGEAKEGEDGAVPGVAELEPNLLGLEPIVTNLAYPSQNRIRLEVALLFKGVPNPEMAENIHQDVLAYLRTTSLQQVQGPRGFQYLRDDIQEIAQLRSQGDVSKVLFRTFVVE